MSYNSPTPVASGATFTQLLTNGFTGHLEYLLTKQVATSSPVTAATLTSAGGGSFGGLLSQGGYYMNFTETNAFGETLPSTESAVFTVTTLSAPSATITVSVGSATTGLLSPGGYFAFDTLIDSTTGGESTVGVSQSALFTATAGTTPTLTLGTLPTYASSRNVYLTSANATAGSPGFLSATNVTATTYVLTSANTTSLQQPPTVNGLSANIPQATFPALQTNNSARNVYLTSAGGGTGTEQLYLRGVTALTVSLSAVEPSTASVQEALPTVNTTAPDTNALQFIRAGEQNNMDMIYRRVRTVLYNYLHGDPMSQSDTLLKFREAHAAIAMLNTTFNEIGTLVDANPGHIVNVITGIGLTGSKRTWP